MSQYTLDLQTRGHLERLGGFFFEEKKLGLHLLQLRKLRDSALSVYTCTLLNT